MNLLLNSPIHKNEIMICTVLRKCVEFVHSRRYKNIKKNKRSWGWSNNVTVVTTI